MNHLANKSPDKNPDYETYRIALFQSNLNSDNCFKRFTDLQVNHLSF